MTLNYIWWWDSSSKDLGNSLFIASIPKSILILSGSIYQGLIYGQIYLFQKDLY